MEGLLLCLLAQKTDGLFDYSITVVDNDAGRSAERIVDKYRGGSGIEINYLAEEVKNISLARNKAVRHSKGNLVAFIDDDEYPEDDWLLSLFKIYVKFSCAGVSGPVHPLFRGNPPHWLKKIKFYYYGHEKSSGEDIRDEFHTGNALVNKDIFNREENYFDPSFGETGGEDTDFFLRMSAKGYNFKWCSEGMVYAVCAEERCRFRWLLKRHLRNGGVAFRLEARGLSYGGKMLLIAKHLLAFLKHLGSLPPALLLGRKIFAEHLLWLFLEIGFFGGIFGYVRAEYK